MYLIFDTETTGLPKKWGAPITDIDNWPRAIQMAWQLHDDLGQLVEHQDYLIKPAGFNIPYDAEKVHGISTELALQDGVDLQDILIKFNDALKQAKFVVGQNVGFDINIIGCEFYRMGIESPLAKMAVLDTCTETTADMLKLPGGRGGRYKLPTLSELHVFLFNQKFEEAHNATADVEATTRCFFELVRQGVFSVKELHAADDYLVQFKTHNPKPIQPIGLNHNNLKEASQKLRQKAVKDINIVEQPTIVESLSDVNYSHLHNHTQFSVLQSTIPINKLISEAAKYAMPAVALTDMGNLMGAFQFVSGVLAYNKKLDADYKKAIEEGIEAIEPKHLKPIVGCELNVCENHLDKSNKDNGYPIVFLAKTKKGYHNLVKLVSKAHTQGFYYVPRIDKNLLLEFKEDLIVLSGGLGGEVPNLLLNVGEKQAEDKLLWWKDHFQEDFYIEICRHQQEDEKRVNEALIPLAKKHGVKLIATNNVFYLNKEEANAHDILLCVRDGEKQATPIGRGRGYRYGFQNQDYYFKSPDEMKAIFKDLPEAIVNTQEIVDKVETFDLSRNVLLPKFVIPNEFLSQEDEADAGKRGENAFLKHITYEGAKKRYGDISADLKERIDFELLTIEKTGYPGYFLIVQDFIAEARKMGVSVGPGRGSAAGSVVAYCLWITNIDPIKYDLLFERFLNPDRVSMPDIDIDFDDEGRSKVMQYVIDKYGKSQVAQIITYGKMATKSAIRDTARVLDLPLFEADKIAKLIPNMMPAKWNLSRFFSEPIQEVKKAVRSDEFERISELIDMANQNDLSSTTLHQAKLLEGSLRNTGVHACGVIITPEDITNFVPISNAKDSELAVTQFDNAVVESAGLLKMDFLGLKTLTLIKDTVKLVKYRQGKDIDPDKFPIDDLKTYELFQRGETVGIFQYESVGMQKYLKDLKPTVFGDLIAMNALYRPGPLEYIPSFVKRKNGLEEITYDLDACEEYLGETYGITVYQEQVMLLSQKLAGFSKGDADVLRKAMGKKDRPTLDKMKPKFIEEAAKKGHDASKLEKIWKDWEAFASYAFNKSHSTCYAWIGYQTAYLKAHYPAEYMAAVLSNNMNDIKQVTFFMEECKRMGLPVYGPDVNESYYKFTVNDNGAIRFGIGAIKGVGEGAVNTIVEQRKKGNYKSIFDLAKRIDLRAANKKAFENLALAGGFDCFQETHRAQYFFQDGDGGTFLEKAIKYGVRFQDNENSSQVSLFGESSDVQIPEPQIPPCEEWATMEKLAKEKEVVGIYISGHPLDDFRNEIKYFCNAKLSDFQDLNSQINRQLSFGGIVTSSQHKVSNNGKLWGIFAVEGFDESFEFKIFGDDYLKFRHLFVQSNFIFAKVMVKEGYVNRETGKKSDPRIQFLHVQSLQDVFKEFAKKLTLELNVFDLKPKLINQLHNIFKNHSGNHPLTIDVLELKETKVETFVPLSKSTAVETDDEIINDDNYDDIETSGEQAMDIQLSLNLEVVNKVSMASRKVKVNITSELLEHLSEKDIKFKLN
jgi:DNA polymerase-3 subunit alpha